MTARVLALPVLILTLLLAALAPATAQTRTFDDPQTADSGAYFMQTTRIVVRNTDRAVHIKAVGTYYWRYIDSVDISVQTPSSSRCWDLRSTQPHRVGPQAHVFFGSHCGDMSKHRCRGARIVAARHHHVLRATIPQSCLGSPRRLRGSVSFSDDTAHLYNQADFGPVRRG